MLDSLTLDQVRVFVAVADAGSFRGAAARLQRAQSAISFAIGNLESQLGVSLFDRTTRKPKLTPPGQALLQDARALLLRANTFRARGRGLGKGIEIAITLAVEVMFPPTIVARAAAALHQLYPSVGLTILSSPLGGPLEAVVTKTASLALILSDELRDPEIELEALGSVVFRAVSAPFHPLAEQPREGSLPTSLLAEHLQIVVPDPTSRSGTRAFGILSPNQWIADDIAMKLALIEAGLGWGHLPDHLASPGIAGGRLTPIRPADTGDNGRSKVLSYLARRHDTALGPATTVLRDEILKAACEHLG